MATIRHEELAVFVWDESSEEELPCAWCDPGVDPEGSHRMCKACAHELKMQHKARKAVKALFQKGENNAR